MCIAFVSPPGRDGREANGDRKGAGAKVRDIDRSQAASAWTSRVTYTAISLQFLRLLVRKQCLYRITAMCTAICFFDSVGCHRIIEPSHHAIAEFGGMQ